LNKKQFADTIGLKPRQIDNLVLDGIPRTKRGRSYDYGIKAVVWYYQRRIDRDKATRPDLKESQERFEAARAKKMELELELLQAESVKARVAREELGRILDRLRARLLNVPATAAPRLMGCKTLRQMTAQLTEGMREALAMLQETADEDNDGTGKRNRRRPAKKKAAKRAARRGSRKASPSS
jgi:phage terminase Nu1 subunit (DNA packaging protein)